MKLHTAIVGRTYHIRPEILNGETRFGTTLTRFVFVLLACFITTFFSTSQAATNANRFLFIIDTSASMKPIDKALRETVFDLVYSGVRGQMTNGDTYGIWVVNDQTDTSFSMESWGQRYNVELGAKATAHVKKHGYQGKARLDLAFADAMRIVRRIGDLTIILVSNGETPIAGTPFDGAVNERFRQLAPEMKKAKATLNTAFVARDGEVVAWAANTSDFLIAVPFVPLKPKPVMAEVAAPKTNALPAAQLSNAIPKNLVSNPTNIEPPKPRIPPKPIIITKETVAEEKRTYQSLTRTTGSTNESALPVVATNSAAVQTNLVAMNVAELSITNVLEPQQAAATTSILPVRANSGNLPTTNPLATSGTLAQAKLESTDSAATVNGPMKLASTERVPAARRMHPAFWAGIGAGTALLVVFAIILVCRSRRQEQSLISQTIGLERIHSPKI